MATNKEMQSTVAKYYDTLM